MATHAAHAAPDADSRAMRRPVEPAARGSGSTIPRLLVRRVITDAASLVGPDAGVTTEAGRLPAGADAGTAGAGPDALADAATAALAEAPRPRITETARTGTGMATGTGIATGIHLTAVPTAASVSTAPKEH
ncbi:hypothetical protein [Streptomyces sp. NPDC058613]|uniref:hypothetical protein n=1 Tax=unclassified Streptomyces TaxID=2593676 RepID=UPI00364FDF1B